MVPGLPGKHSKARCFWMGFPVSHTSSKETGQEHLGACVCLLLWVLNFPAVEPPPMPHPDTYTSDR